MRICWNKSIKRKVWKILELYLNLDCVFFFYSEWLISIFLFSMASLRSKDSHFVFDQLAPKQKLYCPSLFLRRERIASGEWPNNVSTQTVAVAHDCAKSGIIQEFHTSLLTMETTTLYIVHCTEKVVDWGKKRMKENV